MGDLIRLRRDPNKDESKSDSDTPHSTGVSEHKEIKQNRTSLIQHLSEVANEQGIMEVIQLLQDIRSYKDYPKMIKAFSENNHKVAHGARDHDKDILELLVDNYLEEHELQSDMLQGDRHKLELSGHVEHFILGALRGYQEVVEKIRSEVPFAPVNPKNPDELKRKLTSPSYGTSAYNICQVLRSAMANGRSGSPLYEDVRNNDQLREIMTRFGDKPENLSQRIMDSYMKDSEGQEQSDELLTDDFENYLTDLLAQVQASCDDDLYQKLLYWSPRQTIPSGPAPASMRAPSITLIPESLNKIVRKTNKQASVAEGKTYTVNTGYSTEIAYAMHDSVIEVKDGARLELFMISNNVVVKLMGYASSVKISRVTRNCENIRILGKDGEDLNGNAPNLELSDEVIEKLKA